MDMIEKGEQEKINGKTKHGETAVSLTALKKDNVAKSWLFSKYYNLCFVDKNPEGAEGAPPLQDESKWEHRIIKDVVWWRSLGYSVESQLRGAGVANQSVEKYQINRELMRMIRDSPHNVRPMFSDGLHQSGDDSDGDGSDDSDDSDGDDSDDSGDSDGTDSHASSINEGTSDDDLPLSSIVTDIRKKRNTDS